MIRVRLARLRLPLIVRVVALYVAIGIPGWFGLSQLEPDQPVASAAAITPAERAKSLVRFEHSQRITGEPIQIRVPRLGVDLAVIDGIYDPALDTWTLTKDKAQFARMTELPNNESGNTFIYGHNTDAVFSPLVWLQSGDEAIITTANGHTFTYLYNGNQIVNPDETSILSPTEAPRLTLMTCEGILSQARRVAVFDFKEVSS